MKASYEAGLSIFKKSVALNIPVIFPTDTIYGIGAPLSAVKANQDIFKIKRRSKDLPFPILAGSFEQVQRIADVTNIKSEAKKYLEKWPGPYTFILKSKPSLHYIYTKNNTVAIRIPDAEWLRKSLIALGEPITATSVNLSKQNHINDLEMALSLFSTQISLFIAGNTTTKSSSTIIDLSKEQVVTIR